MFFNYFILIILKMLLQLPLQNPLKIEWIEK